MLIIIVFLEEHKALTLLNYFFENQKSADQQRNSKKAQKKMVTKNTNQSYNINGTKERRKQYDPPFLTADARKERTYKPHNDFQDFPSGENT